MKNVCRWCMHYMPNERYKGFIGWCKEHDKPSTVDNTCEKMTEGKQHWLCGKEVKA